MTVTISIISTTKPASSIFSLTRMLKSRRASALERHDEDVAAVEDRDRHQVEQAEVQADRRHQAEQRDPAELRRLAGQLRDRRPVPSAASARSRRVNRPQSVSKIRPAILDVLLRRSCRSPRASPGLNADASRRRCRCRAARSSPLRAGVTAIVMLRAVAQNRQRDRLLGMLGDRFAQLVAERDRLRRRPRAMTSPALRPACSAGSPGCTDADVRMHVGQHADVAELEPALAGRRPA